MYMNKLQSNIIDILKKTGKPLNRNDLVRLLNTPRTTIYDNIVPLIKDGLIIKFPVRKSRGRPVVYYKLNGYKVLKNEL